MGSTLKGPFLFLRLMFCNEFVDDGVVVIAQNTPSSAVIIVCVDLEATMTETSVRTSFIDHFVIPAVSCLESVITLQHHGNHKTIVLLKPSAKSLLGQVYEVVDGALRLLAEDIFSLTQLDKFQICISS